MLAEGERTHRIILRSGTEDCLPQHYDNPIFFTIFCNPDPWESQLHFVSTIYLCSQHQSHDLNWPPWCRCHHLNPANYRLGSRMIGPAMFTVLMIFRRYLEGILRSSIRGLGCHCPAPWSEGRWSAPGLGQCERAHGGRQSDRRTPLPLPQHSGHVIS